MLPPVLVFCRASVRSFSSGGAESSGRARSGRQRWYANHIELQRDMAQMAREARELSVKARRLEAENKRLRKALEPITRGTFFFNDTDVQRAYKALGKEFQLSVKPAQPQA